MSTYAPLLCKSSLSFLEGASEPEELVEQAHRYGLPALALTDRDGVYGVVRGHMEAKVKGVRLIVGSQITVDDGTVISLLAENLGGYARLCRLITRGRLRCEKGRSQVSWREICEHAEGLIALWGGLESALTAEREPALAARWLGEAFGERLFAAVARHRRPEESREEPRLRERARRFGIPLVAAGHVLYHTPARRPLQDVLTCLRHKCVLSTAGRDILPSDQFDLKSPEAFWRLYDDEPLLVDRTLEIAERCAFSLGELRYRYPTERLPDGSTSAQYLRHLTFEGARQRYGEVPRQVAEQIDKELAVIEELDYPGYFLTMWEIVQFCRQSDILCQGRGSAANSAVCYCLGITAVDPVRMNLLFERFISKERAEPPDIDLDIEHERREEVIQHVYTKYGREKAAMVAVVIRYRPKSAVRDVGKVLGVPQTTLDRLARVMSRYETIPEDRFEQAGLSLEVPAHQKLLHLSREILGFPRHLSIHPGGFLLGHTPVHDLVPIENGTMADRTVIQWDKDDVEALGLFKVDLLGLGALSHLHRCFDLIWAHRKERLTMATLPPDDPETFAMIRRAETVGVFQIESRAQMAMLPRLRPKTFYDLVIEVSIVRPGPITGGMVHPYLRRRSGEEEVVYPHASLKPVLEKTLGVPLFQEQVMKLAVVAADYTPGEADQLRRDMAAWRKAGRIERHRARLISRMEKKGIEREFAERVFEQIRGFGEYGFPESHAASFALISYATAYLRCHYPAEFVCGLLNSQPMGFYTPATIVEDAKRMKVEVRPVDVWQSGWDCTLEPSVEVEGDSKDSPVDEVEGDSTDSSVKNSPLKKGARGILSAWTSADRPFAVRVGLRFIKGLGRGDFERIARARTGGPWRTLAELGRLTRLDSKALKALAESGALAMFGVNRREALWALGGIGRGRKDSLVLDKREDSPHFEALGEFDEIAWDYGASGHSTRGHPLGPLRPRLRSLGLPTASQLSQLPDGKKVRYAGMVICRQRPSTASGVTFMTLEDETGFVNLVVWRDVFQRQEILAKTAALLGVDGRLQKQDGVTHLVADTLWVPRFSTGDAVNASRDFR